MSKFTRYCFKCKRKVTNSETYNSHVTKDIFGNKVYEIKCKNC